MDIEEGYLLTYYKDYVILSRDLSTGLKDKNGKEIYVGDICTVSSVEDINYRAIVRFGWSIDGDYGFHWESAYKGVKFSKGSSLRDVDGIEDRYEIIGNIHDNPNLLDKPI